MSTNKNHEVKKLSILALLSAKEHLQKTWTQLKELKNVSVTEDSEERQKLIEHYKPYREILARSSIFWDFQKSCSKLLLSDTLKTYKACEDDDEKFAKLERNLNEAYFLIWLCFENVETQNLEIKIGDNMGVETLDAEKISYLSKQPKNLDDCLALNLESNDKKMTKECYENLSSLLLTKLSNVKKLKYSIDVYAEKQATKLFPDVFSQFKLLTKVDVDLNSNLTAEAFANFVEKSPKILDTLRMNIGCNLWGEYFDKIAKSLRDLPKLKSVTMNLTSSNNLYGKRYLEARNEYPVNDSVERLSLQLYEPVVLKLVDKFFEKIKVFTIDLTNWNDIGCKPEECNCKIFDFRWSDKILTQLNLSNNYHSVISLEIITMKMKYFFTCAKLFEIFPNVQEFYCGTFNAGDLKEMKSLKKLVIKYGKIEQPKLLLKFPNLMHFSMDWSKSVDDRIQEIKSIKEFLPLQCKLYENEEIISA